MIELEDRHGTGGDGGVAAHIERENGTPVTDDNGTASPVSETSFLVLESRSRAVICDVT